MFRSCGYIGTLFPVLSSEAAEVATKLLDEHWGKLLAIALWSAQRDVYGTKLRHPYVAAGVFSQKLRVDPANHPARIKRQLASSLEGYRALLARAEESGNVKRAVLLKDIVKIFEGEFNHFDGRNGQP